jgi:DNA-binding XRE family transcriptional regulator
MGAPASSEDVSTSSNEWNYSSGIKIFYLGEGQPPPLTATGFIPMPPDRPVPGYLCQAARALLNVSQAWLWQRAKVSRKTINDFENGYATPKIALNLRMKRALEHAGAQFVHGEDMVGVVVYAAKAVAKR